MIESKSLEFSDFSGGITDNIIDGVLNKYEKAENLIIDKNRKLTLAPGSEIIGSATYQVPVGAERVNALIDHDDTLFHTSLTQLSYTGTSSNTNLLGPGGDTAFDIGTATNKVSWATWNKHLYITNDGFPNIQKVYKDSNGDWQTRTAGLPTMTVPTVTAGASGSNSHIYGFVYYYTYTVGDVTFEDFGAVTEVTVGSAAAPDATAIEVTAIPVISGGNYDTSNIKVKIYRTANNGTILYYVGEVTNGTTTYSDNTADSVVIGNETIYTTGDVVDNDAPPKAKFIHVAGDVCWYAHVSEGGVAYPNKIRQSIKGDPDSCPVTFFAELEDEITGISSVQGVPIVFCKNSVYRLEGFFDELGRGSIVARRISDSIGAISNNSIVQALNVLYFAGNDGFYSCDGFNILKLTNDLNTTYKTIINSAQQKLNIYGVFDKINNKILWAAQQDESEDDNDSIFVLDLSWTNGPNSAFTTMGGSRSFAPSALGYFDNQIIRGDIRGYLFKHDTSYYTNPKINESDVPANWTVETIQYDFRSIYTSFGSTLIRKWVPWMSIDLINESNIAVQIVSDNDKEKNIRSMALMVHNDNIVWGDPLLVWGNSTTVWGVSGIIERKKRFPKDGLRCTYKQIRMANGYTVVQKSDDYGLATVDATAKTATLDDAVNVDWDASAIDYYISFNDDSYAQEYLIEARTDDVVTFSDAFGSAVDGSQKWMIKGYRKGERFHLLAYALQYGMLSRSQRPHGASDLGENA